MNFKRTNRITRGICLSFKEYSIERSGGSSGIVSDGPGQYSRTDDGDKSTNSRIVEESPVARLSDGLPSHGEYFRTHQGDT